MTQVIPTILATSEEKYKEDIDKVLSVPELANDWVQIDLMDNVFVQNLSIGLDVIGKYHIFDKTEAHMMVSKPKEWFKGLKALGFKRVLFPVEVGDTQSCISEAKNMGFEVGLTINPPTNLDLVLKFISKVDVILVMGVIPGFQGQPFAENTYERVAKVAEHKKDYNFLIEVDGGVNPENAKKLSDAGVDMLAVGSKLFNGYIAQNFEKFKVALSYKG